MLVGHPPFYDSRCNNNRHIKFPINVCKSLINKSQNFNRSYLFSKRFDELICKRFYKKINKKKREIKAWLFWWMQINNEPSLGWKN